jgi:hypothetical protein
MLGIPAAAEVPSLVGGGLVLLRGILHATIRVIMCRLAAQAVRNALRDPDVAQDTADIRAHHLAVLQSVLAAMSPSFGNRRR